MYGIRQSPRRVLLFVPGNFAFSITATHAGSLAIGIVQVWKNSGCITCIILMSWQRLLSENSKLHSELLQLWIEGNPPGKGNGWEPYPTSLRVVNWIKWVLAGNIPPADFYQSLAMQVRFLCKRLEYHLLGNHLFANAKALVFAGLFFNGPEAEKWFSCGMAILGKEIPEQVLADGGHFERSPMYHSIILEDMLDMANLFQAYGKDLPCSLARQNRGNACLVGWHDAPGWSDQPV